MELTMEKLKLVDAFDIFGGKPVKRLCGLSAVADDGTMILRPES
jgi:hypothetical protein